MKRTPFYLIISVLIIVIACVMAYGQQVDTDKITYKQADQGLANAVAEFNAAQAALETAQQRLEAAKWRVLFWKEKVAELKPAPKVESEATKPVETE